MKTRILLFSTVALALLAVAQLSSVWSQVVVHPFPDMTQGIDLSSDQLALDMSDEQLRISANGAYDIGSPTLQDVWVDPVNGNDGNTGDSRGQALQSLRQAWGRVPSDAALTTGYRILLVAGDYPESKLPDGGGWMASRSGTYQFPIILQAADGAHSARLHGPLNINDCHYLYIINLDFVTDPESAGGGNVVHVSSSDHILIRGSKLDGFDGTARKPQETLKVNQVQYVYVEDSEIAGAERFPLDFVAVQYGNILNSSLHNAGDDCVVLKGGTAYFRVEGNEVYDCDTIGFSAGQGTGFEFMVSPWLHYEAYDLKFVNNVVHDTQNAGMAVRGGYNILLAYNTLFRTGIDTGVGASLLLVGHGSRSCDTHEGAPACQSNSDAGGWGPTTLGEGGEWIPNRNVYVYNNIFYNPSPARTMWSHFTIPGPVTPPPETNIPSPSASDTNLQIRGNMIWNGPSDLSLGVGDVDQGCQASNPTCNPAQLVTDNKVNLNEPALLDPAQGNFRPSPGGTLFTVTTYAIPDFGWDDAPTTPRAPPGTLSNSVPKDRDGNTRAATGPPGAYAVITTTTSQQPTTTSTTSSTTQVQTTTTSTQQETTSSISTSSTSSGPESLSTTSTTPTTSTTTAESTSSAAPPGPGIPGFPIEAIVLGVIVGMFMLSLGRLRRRSQSCVSGAASPTKTKTQDGATGK